MPKYISGLSDTGLLADGDYPFSVTSSKLRKAQKSGSEMIEIILETGDNGHIVKIKDFFVFDGGIFTSSRIDQFRKSIGEIILEGEEIFVQPGDWLHKTGKCHVITEEWNNKKRNKVGSYLEPVDEIPGLAPEPKAKKQPLSKLI